MPTGDPFCSCGCGGWLGQCRTEPRPISWSGLSRPDFVTEDELGQRARKAYYFAIDGWACAGEWQALSDDERKAWIAVALAIRGAPGTLPHEVALTPL